MMDCQLNGCQQGATHRASTVVLDAESRKLYAAILVCAGHALRFEMRVLIDEVSGELPRKKRTWSATDKHTFEPKTPGSIYCAICRRPKLARIHI